jgi:hypothetical protein
MCHQQQNSAIGSQAPICVQDEEIIGHSVKSLNIQIYGRDIK